MTRAISLVVAVASMVAGLDASGQQPPPIVPGVPVLPVPPSPVDLNAKTLHVGPGAEFATPSAAALMAHDGDTIEIAPGDYRGDVAVWGASRLHIVGAKSRPRIVADGRQAQGKGTWVVKGDDVLIENVEMSGSKVPDGNGAAIRLEGRNFVLRDAYLHDNENGILAGPNATSEVTIDHCEFARNGSGDGFTHNLYIGAVAKLTVTKSYLHHAINGHNLKSRAAVTTISDSRLADEGDGRASYEADFPNGGRVTLAFNVFQKSVNAQNDAMVAYGEEGLASVGTHELVAKGNTFVSQRPGGVRFIAIAPGKVTANIIGNVFAGQGTLPDLANLKANNAVQKEMPGNVDLRPDGF